MKQIHFKNSITVDASPHDVFEHMIVLANQVGLQPLIIGVQEISRGSDAQGQPIVDFYLVELIRLFKVIPYHNRIRVQMTTTTDKQIHYVVKSFPRVRLWSVFEFVAEGSGTAVHETVTITTPNFVARFVEETAVAAHKTLLQNLKRRLENGGAGN